MSLSGIVKDNNELECVTPGGHAISNKIIAELGSSIPNMTSNTEPLGVGTIFSSTVQGGVEPFNAFIDSDASSYSVSNGTQNSLYIGIIYDTPKEIVKYSLRNKESEAYRMVENWFIEGSDDGDSWVILDQQTGIDWSNTYQTKEFDITNPGKYTHYRLRNAGVGANKYISIEYIDFISYDYDFTFIHNLTAKSELANISLSTVADLLLSTEVLQNGDSIAIVKNDKTIEEMVLVNVENIYLGLEDENLVPLITGPTASVTSSENVSTDWKAFNRDNDDTSSVANLIGVPGHITYEFSEVTLLGGYGQTYNTAYLSSGSTSEWTVLGSLTGEFIGEEFLLDSQTDIMFAQGENKKFVFDTPTEVKFIRFHITDNNNPSSNNVVIDELQYFAPKPVYRVDVSSVTVGEIPTRVYKLSDKVFFNNIEVPKLSNDFTYPSIDDTDPFGDGSQFAYYPFADDSTDLVSGRTSADSNITYTDDGEGGTAATFNGSNSLIQLDFKHNDATNGEFTVVMKVKLDPSASKNGLFTEGSNSENGITAWIDNSDKFIFGFYDTVQGDHSLNSGGSDIGIMDNEWIWVAVVGNSEGGTVKIITPFYSRATTFPIKPTAASHNMRLGITKSYTGALQDFFKGQMKDFRFFTRALTTEEFAVIGIEEIIYPVNAETTFEKFGIGSPTIETKIELNAVGNKLKELKGDLFSTFTTDDINIPVITLLGDSSVIVIEGDEYSDAGATALDTEDGDITSDIVVTNNVDVNAVGSYTITYNVRDDGRNDAVEVVRNIDVITLASAIPGSVVNLTTTLDEEEQITVSWDDPDTGVEPFTFAVFADGEEIDTDVTSPYILTEVMGDYDIVIKSTNSYGSTDSTGVIGTAVVIPIEETSVEYDETNISTEFVT